MSPINYFYEDTGFILENQAALNTWIENTIQSENHTLVSINYIFCSDAHLLQVNRDYLNHDYYTDIITFDNSESEQELESDIFISIDRVEDNAFDNNTDFTSEIHRVMIHGVLHLIGYNDKSSEEKKEMREKENAYLSLLDFEK